MLTTIQIGNVQFCTVIRLVTNVNVYTDKDRQWLRLEHHFSM